MEDTNSGVVSATDDQSNQVPSGTPDTSLEPTGQDTPNNVNEHAPGESKATPDTNPAPSGVATQRDGEVAPQVGAVDLVARRAKLSDLLSAVENALRSLDGWVNVDSGGDVTEVRDHLQAAREWVGAELGLETDENGNQVLPAGQTEGARASQEAADDEVKAAERAKAENEDIGRVLDDDIVHARDRATALGNQSGDSQANAEVEDNPPAPQTP